MIAWLLISFAVLMLLGIPIGISLGLSAVGGIVFISGGSIDIKTITQRMFEGMNSWALLAIPLYTFAGYTMSKGGISRRLMDFCYAIVGHIYGGLAHVNVLASMIFAGISGSAVADTAGAAADISKGQLHGHAAICHKDAAQIYGMKVLQEGIETNKHNFTRFLVVASPEIAPELRDLRNVNKSSLAFTLPHEEGSLSAILSVLSFYKLNLTKIQSLPIIGMEWQYMFYIDLTFSDYIRYRQAINAITPLTRNLKLLGEYEDGKQSI